VLFTLKQLLSLLIAVSLDSVNSFISVSREFVKSSDTFEQLQLVRHVLLVVAIML